MAHIEITHQRLVTNQKFEPASVNVSDAARRNFDLAQGLSIYASIQQKIVVALIHPKGIYKSVECFNEPGSESPQSILEKMLSEFDQIEFEKWLAAQ